MLVLMLVFANGACTYVRTVTLVQLAENGVYADDDDDTFETGNTGSPHESLSSVYSTDQLV